MAKKLYTKAELPIVVIHENDEKEGNIYLGSARAPKPMTQTQAEKEIHRLWDMWRKEVENPDTDSEFVDEFLPQHGWEQVDKLVYPVNV